MNYDETLNNALQIFENKCRIIKNKEFPFNIVIDKKIELENFIKVMEKCSDITNFGIILKSLEDLNIKNTIRRRK